MKLQEILTESRFQYGVGDIVKTPFGPGQIVKDLGADRNDHYYQVAYDAQQRAKFNLEDNPIRLGSFQFSGIIQKA